VLLCCLSLCQLLEFMSVCFTIYNMNKKVLLLCLQSQLCAGIFVSLVQKSSEQDADLLDCHTVLRTCKKQKTKTLI